MNQITTPIPEVTIQIVKSTSLHYSLPPFYSMVLILGLLTSFLSLTLLVVNILSWVKYSIFVDKISFIRRIFTMVNVLLILLFISYIAARLLVNYISF